MNREQILDAIEMLAHSQGFYGRLLEEIMSAPEDVFENVMNTLEAQKFGNVVDMVMFFEC